MRKASGARYSIEGYGDLPLTFRSSEAEVGLLLRGVVNVPCLIYHLFSLRVAADNEHQYKGIRGSVRAKLTTGEQGKA